MPEDATEAIRRQARRQGIAERLHKPRLAALIDSLAAAGVPSLLLKGAAFAYLFYASPARMYDLEGEAAFLEERVKALATRPVIVITHRPASLALADRIVELPPEGWLVIDPEA